MFLVYFLQKEFKLDNIKAVFDVAKIAQLVEHIHGKDEVPGSIPGLGSAIKENDFLVGFWYN